MDLIKTLSEQYMKPELPAMNVGDTVRVNETITVRRISYNVGCEKVFPVHSPSIVSVETIRRGKVRRAKLYYLRSRVGKKAKVKEQI
jgi:large subunit ribosomal protein L19